MFDKAFYPTPIEVLELMDIDCENKVVLEPSAGKGDILKYLRQHGAKKLLACELNHDLAMIAIEYCDDFITHDFLKVTKEQVAGIDMIVMNPPFHDQHKHIMHAVNISPPGTEIIALCNYDAFHSTRTSSEHRELKAYLENYGTIVNMGSVFDKAERKTNVEIGLIKIYVPSASKSDNEWSEYFFEEEDIPDENNQPGLMTYNKVRDIVQRYVAACKEFKAFEDACKKMNYLTKMFSAAKSFDYSVNISNIKENNDYYKKNVSYDEFKIYLQKCAWHELFKILDMDKYLVESVRQKINNFADEQQKIPFTEKNVYRMFEIIQATSHQNFMESLVNIVDYFTRHTHENRFGVEGWKTNSGHMLNKRFIVSYIFEPSYRKGLSIRSDSRNYSQINDLHKILCHLTQRQNEIVPNRLDYQENPIPLVKYDIWYACRFLQDSEGIMPGQWYEWGFFKFRAYKKGTVHFEFLDDLPWALINQAYAKHHGISLPEKTWVTPKKAKKKNDTE